MITITAKGDFKKTDKFLEKMLNVVKLGNLDKYGREGVNALAAATPKRTGKTAASWNYRINRSNGQTAIEWYNTNTNNNVNIAVILQYGHGTRQGAYVRGIDYINPAMRPVFDRIADDAWKEVRES